MPGRSEEIRTDNRHQEVLEQENCSTTIMLTLNSRVSESSPSLGDCRVTTFVQAAEQNRGRLLWVAQRMTCSRDVAEDIVQEALLRAFRKLTEFRGESQMSTWLCAIVQNTAREYLRSRRGRQFLPLEMVRNGDEDSTLDDFPDPRSSPEEDCARIELEKILLTEVDALGPFSKRAIQLCMLDELPQVAAATALNVSISSIKSRVFRGKRILMHAVRSRIGTCHEAARSAEMGFLADEGGATRVVCEKTVGGILET